MSKQAIQKCHHLVTGQIVFEVIHENAPKDSAADIHAVQLNAVVTTPNGRISSSVLARAQQGLQIRHSQRLGESAQYARVVDVAILGIYELGYFTDEEFADTTTASTSKETGIKPVSPKLVNHENQEKGAGPNPYAK